MCWYYVAHALIFYLDNSTSSYRYRRWIFHSCFCSFASRPYIRRGRIKVIIIVIKTIIITEWGLEICPSFVYYGLVEDSIHLFIIIKWFVSIPIIALSFGLVNSLGTINILVVWEISSNKIFKSFPPILVHNLIRKIGISEFWVS